MIQWRNVSNKKSQTVEDENFIKFSYSMMMKEFEYHTLFKRLNEEQRLIFDGVMHRKQLYPGIWICYFL